MTFQSGDVKQVLDVFFRWFTLAPFILAIITIILIANANKKLASYAECQGVITGFYENTTELRVGSYENVAVSPIVAYEVDGVKYEFIGNYYSTSMKIGDSISVLYQPDNVAKAVIKKGVRFGATVTGSLAIIFLIPIIVYFVLKNKGII